MPDVPITRGSNGGPVDQQSLRAHNLALVLQHVAVTSETSRATLAEATGLNKTTVSTLVTELLDRQLVVERGVRHEGHVGRPPVRIQLAQGSWSALGVEINVESVAAVVTNLTGEVVTQQYAIGDNRQRDPADVMARASRLACEVVTTATERGLQVIGAGVSIAGLVDPATGHLLHAPNIGWRNLSLAPLLDGVADDSLPIVVVDNEANLSALAERWHGVGRELHDFMHVSGEVGVGAGIILGDHLHRGVGGFGGEFGHMTLVPDGPACGCGSRGCVETYVGLEAMFGRTGFDATAILGHARKTGEDPASTIAAAARAGNATVLDGLRETGSLLGTALASAVNLIGPQPIVLGGYFAPLYEWLAEPARQELAERALVAGQVPIPVLASRLRRWAGVRGAAEAVIQAVLANPVVVPVVATTTSPPEPV